MPSLPTDLTQWAICIAQQRAIDAHTVEDALSHHSELLDLLAMEVMTIKMSARSEAAKNAAIGEINACAAHHRDIVDRLTDVIESKNQLIWRP